jgi:heavy metal sensor kinase
VNSITRFFSKINVLSLRGRLTIGIAALSTLGLSSLGIWTSWKMQQILINSHKEYIEEIATNLPRDISVYSEMLTQEEAINKAINKSTINNTYLWVKTSNKNLIESNNLNTISQSTKNKLVSLTNMSIQPYVYQVKDKYFILCRSNLKLKDNVQGNIAIARDITKDQQMFISMVQSIIIGYFLVITFILITISVYIKYSLKPLHQISKIAEDIKFEDISKVSLHLKNPPQEVEELANTFNIMLSRLSQSWKKEREFVSNVSHELRTPLTIVHGYLQSLLRRQQNLTEIQKEALETAASETERTIKMLQDLLNLARADNGHLHLNIQPILLNELVSEVQEMTQKYTGREITVLANEKSIFVKADSSNLKQVLLNLIDNAVNYSPVSSSITVKLQQEKKNVTIQVCDQGEGISLQHQSRIFERFYRVDEARNRSNSGVGLGLSIAKTLVEAMGGNISVRSKLGEGSIFIVSLPIF